MNRDRHGFRRTKHYAQKPIPPIPFDPARATAQEFLDESQKGIDAGHMVLAEGFARQALKHPRLSQREFARCHLLIAKALLALNVPTAGDFAAQADRIARRSGLPELAQEAQGVQREADRQFFNL